MADLIDKYSVPRVGLGVMVWKDGKILPGKRRSEMGDGEWCMPGGHLEYGESAVDGVCREAFEEAGIELADVMFVSVSNVLTYLPRHYVTIGFSAQWKAGEPRAEADEKIGEWMWADPDALPAPMFAPSVQLLTAYREKTQFVDAKG